MNRQIIAFLSLFSLVLVLSIYYVLVPVSAKDVAVGLSYEAKRDAFFTSILIQKESRQLEYINNQSLVVVSLDATSAEKAQATINIDKMRSTMQTEQEMAQSIREIGFDASYVEVKSANTVVIVAKAGDIESSEYVEIFNLLFGKKLKNPVIYDYNNPPASLISD